MKHISEVIETIKTMDLSIDATGRIVIRLPNQVKPPLVANSSLTKKYKSLDMQHITASLLHPEDRVPRQNLLLWLNQLLQQLTTLQAKGSAPEPMAVLFNLSSLVFSLLGESRQAELLCRKQIAYFIVLAKQDARLLKYIMQPWINLARLDRINHRYSAAILKYQKLQSIIQSTYQADDDLFNCPPTALHQAIGLDKPLINILETCLVVEPIKVHLQATSYDEIDSFTKQILSHSQNTMHQSICYEAQVIAAVAQQEIAKALATCEKAMHCVPPHLSQVFMYRSAEIKLALNDPQAKSICQKLCELIHYQLCNTIDSNHIIFGLQFAKRCHQSYPIFSTTTYELAYQAALKIEDECLQFAALQGLVKSNRKSNYKHKLAQLQQQSFYHHIYCSRPKSLPLYQGLQTCANQLFDSLMML